jgi:hypothetical protein
VNNRRTRVVSVIVVPHDLSFSRIGPCVNNRRTRVVSVIVVPHDLSFWRIGPCVNNRRTVVPHDLLLRIGPFEKIRRTNVFSVIVVIASDDRRRSGRATGRSRHHRPLDTAGPHTVASGDHGGGDVVGLLLDSIGARTDHRGRAA